MDQLPSFREKFDDLGTVFPGDGRGGFQFIPASVTGFCIRGNVRDIVQDRRRIIFSRNNELPEVYELK